nr:MAG TPA: hypothetical protein [Caudoviricetes sp.]
MSISQAMHQIHIHSYNTSYNVVNNLFSAVPYSI